MVLIAPRITEKAIGLAETGTYVFDVPMAANKIEITKTVEKTFNVNVVDVNIIITKGKVKRFKQVMGRQRDTKKALVRLASGQKIALFEGAQ